MVLATNLISTEEWIKHRELHGVETKNASLIHSMNEAIESLRSKYTGAVVYYKHVKTNPHNSRSIIEYTESSPFARMFKVSPSGYYIYNFEQNDLWKRHSIDEQILNRFSTDTNKYTQPESLYEIQHEDYVLFCLQANASRLNHPFNIRGMYDILKWSKDTKTPVYFKMHPHMNEDSHLIKMWSKLDQHGLVTDLTRMVDKSYQLDHLIDNSKAVWTFSSGAGFQAILKNKPVAHFYENTDYSAISLYAKTPEEAITAKPVSDEDKLRFLSWYYHKLTLDVTALNFLERLDERFDQVFNHELPINEIF